MANQNVCLISTVHDPAGKLAPFIHKYLPLLTDIYSEIRVNVTEKTHLETWKALGEYGSIGKTAGNGAEGRRRALRLGLESECDVFHYCDFDRILYWVAHRPDELRELLWRGSQINGFVVLQRTHQALQSHPVFQRLTERVANYIFRDLYHLPLDYLSGSRIISRRYAEKIVHQSKANNAAVIDFEWPALMGGGYAMMWLYADGLAYEHRFLGIEKPFFEEVNTRLVNLFEIIKLRYVTR